MCWGAPKVEQAQRIVDAFAGVWAPTLAERVDVVLDGRGITSIRADALDLLVTWSRSRVAELRSRVRKQVGVVDDGLTGFTLSGILPIVGRTHAFEVVNDRSSPSTWLGGRGAAPCAPRSWLWLRKRKGTPPRFTACAPCCHASVPASRSRALPQLSGCLRAACSGTYSRLERRSHTSFARRAFSSRVGCSPRAMTSCARSPARWGWEKPRSGASFAPGWAALPSSFAGRRVSRLRAARRFARRAEESSRPRAHDRVSFSRRHVA